MKPVASVLATYVPRCLVDRLAEGRLAEYELHEEGAVVFADISGFTALTEKLAKAGPEGAERLTRLLDTYFGELVDAMLDAGGDIIKFAGDALIAVWRRDSTVTAVELVRSVAATTLAMQTRLAANPAAVEANLSLKLSVGYGAYRTALLGGMLGRWETIITGEPLAQVGRANHAATAGEVILSEEAWNLVGTPAAGRPAADPGTWLLEKLDHAPRPPAPDSDFPPSIEPKLRACTPAAIRSRLDAGLTDWLGESRRVSILFVNLPGLAPSTALEAAQETLRTVQANIYQFEGSLNKISVDDKGASILAVFGLPPLAHSDDPDRALCAAMSLREAFAATGEECSVGIATGAVFCGSMGSKRRREYTVLGDTVNLAARLMMAAKGGLLCDDATVRGARSVLGTFELKPLPPLTLKGKAEPVAIYRPERRAQLAPKNETSSAVPLLGRKAEQERVDRIFEALESGTGSFLLISGEAGIGKSRFVEYVLESAAEKHYTVLSGSAEVTEQSTPYRAWRTVFRRMFGLPAIPGGKTSDEERAVVLSQVEPGRAPYLNDVLGLGIPETEQSKALAGPFRAAAVRAFLLSLLSTGEKPIVLVIEDLHWADSASLTLLQEATTTLSKAFISATSRPVQSAFTHQPLAELFALPEEKRMNLETLAPEEAARLVARRVGIPKLAPDVERLISETALGHPFFSEEFAYALRDAGVDLETGEGMAGGARRKLPDTLQGVITSRIDRLAPDRQLSLKVASVIGRAFPIETVQGIHPLAGEADRIDLHFDELEQLQLTPLEIPAPNLAYVFKHPLTHEVTYNLMLYSQRRELHRKAAAWYEASAEFGGTQSVAFAAYHYARAVDPENPEADLVERAVASLRSAGDLATHAFANVEAIGHYREALQLVALLPASPARDATELSILLSLGTVLLASSGYSSEDVQQTYTRAEALCAAVGSDDDRFTALRGLWAFYTARGDYRVAENHARSMLGIAESRGEPALLLESYRSLGNTLFWIGKLEDSVAAMERAVELYDFARDKELAYRFGQDPDVACKGLQAWPLTIRGELDAASERSALSFERAKEVGHPYSLGYAQVHLAVTHQLRGNVAETLRTADEGIAFSSTHGFPNWLLAQLMLKGWAIAKSGDPATGRGLLEGTLGTWRGIGCGLAVPYFLTLLAEIHLVEGNAAKALEVIDDALAVTARQDERWFEPETWRLRAEALKASGWDSSSVAAAVLKAKECAAIIGAELFSKKIA